MFYRAGGGVKRYFYMECYRVFVYLGVFIYPMGILGVSFHSFSHTSPSVFLLNIPWEIFRETIFICIFIKTYWFIIYKMWENGYQVNVGGQHV